MNYEYTPEIQQERIKDALTHEKVERITMTEEFLRAYI